jgi:hypothetical protein
MTRKLTVCSGALLALLLLCSDASAYGGRRAAYGSGCGSANGGYGYSANYGYAPGYGGYGYGGYGYGGYGYGGYGYGYNPGGLGGPRSGLGVRPGLGFGGVGLGR